MLGNMAGVIQPGGVVLAVLVGAMWAQGSGKSHLLTGCKGQGINSSHLSLGVNMACGFI